MENVVEAELNKFMSVQNEGLRSCSLSSANIIGKFLSNHSQNFNSDNEVGKV